MTICTNKNLIEDKDFFEKFKIGILGGSGPIATAEFYKKILDISSCKYGAIQDDEYPTIMIVSMTLEYFSHKGIEHNDNVLEQLISYLIKLKEQECDFITIPCVSLHHYLPILQGYIKVPIIDTREILSEFLYKKNILNVTILCSSTSRKNDLFKSSMDKKGIMYNYLSEEKQNIIDEIILNIMQGEITKSKKLMHTVLESIPYNKSIIFGCTELNLISDIATEHTVIDVLDIMASYTTELSYKGIDQTNKKDLVC